MVIEFRAKMKCHIFAFSDRQPLKPSIRGVSKPGKGQKSRASTRGDHHIETVMDGG
jgi:hypothetical protein